MTLCMYVCTYVGNVLIASFIHSFIFMVIQLSLAPLVFNQSLPNLEREVDSHYKFRTHYIGLPLATWKYVVCMRAVAQRTTSAVTKFSLSSTLAGTISPQIFAKFGTLISGITDRAEFVCDRKWK